MQLHRRLLLHLVTAGAAYLTTLSLNAYAQSYPTRSVHIIVGFPAGGTADIVARLVGQRLSEKLNQQFVIENRPGAGTNIATETVVRAPPDGYTLLATASTNTINPAFYSNLNFNFVRDVTMVSGISRQPLVLDVYPSVPVTSVPELIAYAKANPGQITMASFGTGTTSQAAIELFKMMADVSLLHVPYHAASSLGERTNAVAPNWASRASNPASPRQMLISSFSFLTTSAGVLAGAPTPTQPTTS